MMFITKEVDLPEPLINAQREKKLLIFAGAGVSMGEPSNLPDFKRLAIEVAKGIFKPEKDEPIDRFLGRLKDHGTNVHIIARSIIDKPNSKPTKLHRDLLLLFPSADEVRIVTTNFDRHFSTVVKDIFKNSVEIYYAPALPLGHKFNGLIYLHGSVDKKPENLILTDRDFGRAYLTEGWATRFLKEMFREYTILFVGYSHDDPIMHYLARGLIPGKNRYATTKPGYDKDWEYRGITPINYPSKWGAISHEALGEAIDAWVKRAKMGSLDHEQRIREIVKSAPPLSQDDADYISNALRDLAKVRFFRRYARSLEWLRWAEKEQAFGSLFDLSEHIDPISQEIAFWFVENFVCEYPDEALALVQRQGQRFNEALWQAIGIELTRHDPPPDSETLAKWTSVLIRSQQSISKHYFLEWQLERCRYPEDKFTAILLFEYLTRPYIKLEPYFSFTIDDDSKTKKVDAEIVVELNEHSPRKFWEKIFKPNLSFFSRKLEPVLTNHLTQANLLLRPIGKADDRWDTISLSRSAIDSHEQDQYREKLDFLIDAARDIIEWMLRNEHDRALTMIDAWSISSVPILKRLAVHGMTESSEIDSDKKIAWILEKDWLYGSGMKHEIFRLLKETYPQATKSARLFLLGRISRGPQGEYAERIKERTRKYEIYNFLVWLNKADPDCSLAAERLKQIQKRYQDFRPREQPDLGIVTSVGWVASHSPLKLEELLEKDPPKEIDWLLAYKGEDHMGPDRKGLLDKVTEAVAKNFEWSWKLVTALQEKDEWNSDLWESIFNGWEKSSLKENQWKDVLNFIAGNIKLFNFAHQLADLLNEGMKREQNGLPLSCLSVAERLANKFFDSYVKASGDKEELENGDWLIKAINHPGGKTVEFWLNALSKRNAEKRENWSGLPNVYKRYFDKVLSGKSITAQTGRIIFASQLHFLFYIDSDWTVKNILPLLDWSRDKRQAQQAWHGYLSWGRWNEALLPELLPLYEQTFPRLKTELSAMHDDFCKHLASIAVLSSINPMKDGWLRNFLLKADSISHRSWATLMGQHLLSLNAELIHELWNRWVNDYWSQRIKGVPLPLSDDEKIEMLEWIIPLEPVFSEVVEKICTVAAPRIKQTHLFHQFLGEKFASKHAKPLTKLLQHLLSNASEPFYHCIETDKLVKSLVDTDAPTSELLRVCDVLARLGCPTASDLKELIERRDS